MGVLQFPLDQSGSNLITCRPTEFDFFQDHTLYVFKVDQSRSNWIKADQTQSLVDQLNLTSFKTIHYMILKWIKVDQTWSLEDQLNLTSFKTTHRILNQIKLDHLKTNWIDSFQDHTLCDFTMDQSRSNRIKADQTQSLVDQLNLTSFKTIHYMILKWIKADQSGSNLITCRPIELDFFQDHTLYDFKADQSGSKQIKPNHL